jgi:hypothetical protein
MPWVAIAAPAALGVVRVKAAEERIPTRCGNHIMSEFGGLRESPSPADATGSLHVPDLEGSTEA